MKNTNYNISDEQEVKEQIEKQENKALQDNQDLKEIMSLPAGQRFLRNFFEDAGIFRDPMSRQALLTYYNCGFQAFAKKLFSKLLIADKELTYKILFDMGD